MTPKAFDNLKRAKNRMQQCAIIEELLRLKQRILDAGLPRTYRAMDGVMKEISYEITEIITKGKK